MKRKICVVTSSRADYGLLRPLLEEIDNDAQLELQLVVTGTHLSPEFGLTYKDIEKDGFTISEKVEIVTSSDTSIGVLKSMGLTLISFADVYERLKPDIVVVPGDRFEIFSVTAAALISKIPIAHINGGEVTKGVFDDSLRHAMTKMSHLHFASTEEYRKRIIQLGEEPKRVFNVGGIGIDNIKNLVLLSKIKIEKKLGFKFKKKNLLITFHPVTLENNVSKTQFQALLETLNELKETLFIFTKANSDPEGRLINKMIDDYVEKHSSTAVVFASLGNLLCLSTMRFVDAVIGNSSSGIMEAPSFKIGTINIGARQEGRIKAKSVIDCEPIKSSIGNAIKKLYSEEFQNILRDVTSPYGDGDSAKKIKDILKRYNLNNIIKKAFYDVEF